MCGFIARDSTVRLSESRFREWSQVGECRQEDAVCGFKPRLRSHTVDVEGC